MMIFFKQRLAFLSVPKTGTTAYQKALGGHADLVITDPPDLKHAPVYRYNRFLRPMFVQVCDVDLEVMAIMREPVSWLGSWWRYRQRPFLDGQPSSTKGISFDAFVEAYLKGKKPAFADVGSQSKFLRRQPNGVGVSHLFRYEDPAHIKAFLSERLEFDFALERTNESPNIDCELSVDVEARYRRKLREEFDLYERLTPP